MLDSRLTQKACLIDEIAGCLICGNLRNLQTTAFKGNAEQVCFRHCERSEAIQMILLNMQLWIATPPQGSR
jgi:hypothetical protein